MTTYSKETALFKNDAIANDIEDAGAKATGFIQEVTNDGVFIHQIDDDRNGKYPTDQNAYGVHISDEINIIQEGSSVATYGQNTRVGGVLDENGDAHGSRTEISEGRLVLYSENDISAFSIDQSGGTTKTWVDYRFPSIKTMMESSSSGQTTTDAPTDIQNDDSLKLVVTNNIMRVDYTNGKIVGRGIIKTTSFSVSFAKGTSLSEVTKAITVTQGTYSTSSLNLYVSYNSSTDIIAIRKAANRHYPCSTSTHVTTYTGTDYYNSFTIIIKGQKNVDVPVVNIEAQHQSYGAVVGSHMKIVGTQDANVTREYRSVSLPSLIRKYGNAFEQIEYNSSPPAWGIKCLYHGLVMIQGNARMTSGYKNDDNLAARACVVTQTDVTGGIARYKTPFQAPNVSMVTPIDIIELYPDDIITLQVYNITGNRGIVNLEGSTLTATFITALP